jgi:DNA-binding PadR family transcriptional regulator
MKVRAGERAEDKLLHAAMHLRQRGDDEWFAFELARAVQGHDGAHLMMAYGSLYKALDQLVRGGFLGTRWEDEAVPQQEGRQRRKRYRLTTSGAARAARMACRPEAIRICQPVVKPVPA